MRWCLCRRKNVFDEVVQPQDPNGCSRKDVGGLATELKEINRKENAVVCTNEISEGGSSIPSRPHSIPKLSDHDDERDDQRDEPLLPWNHKDQEEVEKRELIGTEGENTSFADGNGDESLNEEHSDNSSASDLCDQSRGINGLDACVSQPGASEQTRASDARVGSIKNCTDAEVDVPIERTSSLDNVASEQYEKACKLLHRSLLQPDQRLTLEEKNFLAGLISSLPTHNDNEADALPPSYKNDDEEYDARLPNPRNLTAVDSFPKEATTTGHNKGKSSYLLPQLHPTTEKVKNDNNSIPPDQTLQNKMALSVNRDAGKTNGVDYHDTEKCQNETESNNTAMSLIGNMPDTDMNIHIAEKKVAPTDPGHSGQEKHSHEGVEGVEDKTNFSQQELSKGVSMKKMHCTDSGDVTLKPIGKKEAPSVDHHDCPANIGSTQSDHSGQRVTTTEKSQNDTESNNKATSLIGNMPDTDMNVHIAEKKVMPTESGHSGQEKHWYDGVEDVEGKRDFPQLELPKDFGIKKMHQADSGDKSLEPFGKKGSASPEPDQSGQEIPSPEGIEDRKNSVQLLRLSREIISHGDSPTTEIPCTATGHNILQPMKNEAEPIEAEFSGCDIETNADDKLSREIKLDASESTGMIDPVSPNAGTVSVRVEESVETETSSNDLVLGVEIQMQSPEKLFHCEHTEVGEQKKEPVGPIPSPLKPHRQFLKNRVELSVSKHDEVELSFLSKSSDPAGSSNSSLPTVIERSPLKTGSFSSSFSADSENDRSEFHGQASKKLKLDEVDNEIIRFDGWAVDQEENEGRDDGACSRFLILGTDAMDDASKPHVLSPPLMEAIRGFLPFMISEENYWMKFSLVRDGSSLTTFLSKVGASSWTIIAIETTEGEVFGSFTGKPWRKQKGYFGSGEAFLWRLKRSRWGTQRQLSSTASIDSELEVYPYTCHDSMVQLCTDDRIAIGGGPWEYEDSPFESKINGVGLLIDSDLFHGESKSCATFGNPPLCKSTEDGFSFDITNLEVWTLTSCINHDEATKMELKKLEIEKSIRLL